MAFSSITYDQPSNTITAKGGASTSPGRLEEIYQASVNGGWGVVAMEVLGSAKAKIFRFTANLVLGDGTTSTWMKTDETLDTTQCTYIFFLNGTIMTVKGNAHWLWGKDYGYGFSEYGGCMAWDNMPAGTGVDFVQAGGEVIWRKVHIFTYGSSFGWLNMYGNMQMYDVLWSTTSRAMRVQTGATIVVNNCQFFSFAAYGGTLTVQRLEVNAWSTPAYESEVLLNDCKIFSSVACSAGTKLHLKNCILPPTMFCYAGTANKVTTILEEHTFDLQVQDDDQAGLDGVAVVLKNVDGDTVYSGSTAGGGVIPQQTVIKHGWYRAQTGDQWEEEYGPFTLELSKAGYIDVVLEVPFAASEDLIVPMGMPLVYQQNLVGEVDIEATTELVGVLTMETLLQGSID